MKNIHQKEVAHTPPKKNEAPTTYTRKESLQKSKLIALKFHRIALEKTPQKTLFGTLKKEATMEKNETHTPQKRNQSS